MSGRVHDVGKARYPYVYGGDRIRMYREYLLVCERASKPSRALSSFRFRRDSLHLDSKISTFCSILVHIPRLLAMLK